VATVEKKPRKKKTKCLPGRFGTWWGGGGLAILIGRGGSIRGEKEKKRMNCFRKDSFTWKE